MKERHQIAVRTLVEYVLRSGDLDMRFCRPRPAIGGNPRPSTNPSGSGRMGIRPRCRYRSSYPHLTWCWRLAGALTGSSRLNAPLLSRRLKSTTKDLDQLKRDPNPCHWGQVKVYAYLLAHERNLDGVTVQLTYVHLDSGDILELVESLDRDVLRDFFEDLTQRYLKWATALTRWRHARDQTLMALPFPFARYRAGQRTMAVAVYRAIRDANQALIQASTGIGKTMAALFPALKTIGEGLTDRIFFLTARNTGKTSAIKALNLLEEKGCRLKRVSLTAKDRICFSPEATCNPDGCEYARGHFDRLASSDGSGF